VQLEEFDLFSAGLGAHDQPDRRFFALSAFVPVEPLEVQLHLSFEPGVELADLQRDRD
jgi:hypothetical protein